MWHNGLQYGMDPGFLFIAGFFKVIGWLIFLALIFGAIRFFRRARYAGVNGWNGRHGWGRGGWNPAAMMGSWGGNGRDEAMETARERVARSELTPEQFEEMKRALKTEEASKNEYSSRDDWRDMKREMRRGWNGGSKDNALETARMRFAKGEISTEEFEMIRRALEN
jgi:uncharacterized membrane protein